MPFGLMYVHAYSIGSVDINTHIRRPESSAIHKRRSARGIGLREDCIAQGKSSTRSRPEHHFDFDKESVQIWLLLAEAKNLNRGRRLMADKATRGSNFLRLTNDFGYYSCAVT